MIRLSQTASGIETSACLATSGIGTAMIVTVAASGIVTTLDIDRALAWQQALVFSGIVARVRVSVFSNPGCKQQPRIEGKNLNIAKDCRARIATCHPAA